MRMSKLSAARIDFGHRGMLSGDILISTRVARGLAHPMVDIPLEVAYEGRHGLFDGEDEAAGDDGPQSDVVTRLATTHGLYFFVPLISHF